MVVSKTNENITTIILSPNRSLDWKEIKLWLLVLCLPACVIGVAWLFMGLWLILPFVGLEVGLLSYFMYRVCYENYRKQLITISKSDVTFCSGIKKPEEHITFTRPDCYLATIKPVHPMEHLKLALANDTQIQPLGEFLNSTERETARKALCRAGLMECSNQWWT